MWLIDELLKAIQGDPAAPKVKPAGVTQLDYVDAIRERRRLMIERDCFRAELLLNGYTEKGLALRVEQYDRALKADVRRVAGA